MIIDILNNAAAYDGLDPRIKKGLEFLLRHGDEHLPVGRHPVDGDRLMAVVDEYQTKPLSAMKFEAHRRYWDIQCVRRGSERIGYLTLAHATRTIQEYNPEKDIAFYEGAFDLITVHENMFVIFAPQDVHAPGLMLNTTAQPVRKIIMKVDMR